MLQTKAIVLQAPEQLSLGQLELNAAGPADVVVEIAWSGISTGTEKLLWRGTMPSFPGMGYPLVPGYESVGHVVQAGPQSGRAVGDFVFVGGANCYGPVRGLFGGAAQFLVVAGARAIKISEQLGPRGILLALAATAEHALGSDIPDLIIGHGVLGRLLARLAVLRGGAPVVWEKNPLRAEGGQAYRVVAPEDDARRDYRCICDVSGDPALLDTLITRLAPGGEIILAGFYTTPLSFAFAPAFLREARLRIAAQWQPKDLLAVRDLAQSGALSLDRLITDHADPLDAPSAYARAFADAACLKMVLDWKASS